MLDAIVAFIVTLFWLVIAVIIFAFGLFMATIISSILVVIVMTPFLLVFHFIFRNR